jgi:hypothetical protein
MKGNPKERRSGLWGRNTRYWLCHNLKTKYDNSSSFSLFTHSIWPLREALVPNFISCTRFTMKCLFCQYFCFYPFASLFHWKISLLTLCTFLVTSVGILYILSWSVRAASVIRRSRATTSPTPVISGLSKHWRPEVHFDREQTLPNLGFGSCKIADCSDYYVDHFICLSVRKRIQM